jgi:uncharacterized protein YsxB (DUF464 family)
MIKAEFRKEKATEQFTKVTLTGHAGQAEKGNDLVCAGVSALFLAVCNGLEEYVGVAPHVQVATDKSEFSFRTDNDLQQIQAQTLMHTFLLAMQGFAEEQSEYVKVTITEE